MDAAPARRPGSSRTWLTRGIGILLAFLLLCWAIRAAPVDEIAEALGKVSLWQVLLLFGVNTLFHALAGLRWWIITRSDLKQVRLLEMLAVRLSSFGVSYFTPGPQVGGEPLQLMYLRRRGNATFARAAATVIMDRLLELLANIVFLVIGAAILLLLGLLGGADSLPVAALVVIALILSWPAVHVILLWRGKYPLSRLVRGVRGGSWVRRAARVIQTSEHLAGRFCQQRPRALAAALMVSLVACGLAVMEYGLVTSFLRIGLTIPQIMGAWTAGWISFLLPLPGGLGALEASQVLALGAFEVSAASALGVTLVLRGRDLVFGGLGLLVAATSLRHSTSKIESPASP